MKFNSTAILTFKKRPQSHLEAEIKEKAALFSKCSTVIWHFAPHFSLSSVLHLDPNSHVMSFEVCVVFLISALSAPTVTLVFCLFAFSDRRTMSWRNTGKVTSYPAPVYHVCLICSRVFSPAHPRVPNIQSEEIGRLQVKEVKYFHLIQK